MIQNPVRPDEWKYMVPLEGDTMLELGDKINTTMGVTYKSWFQHLHLNHTSVDWNGNNGALPYDLTKPLPFERPFDIVTNIGTTEHVEDQAAVWKNIWDMVRVRGVLVSVTPYPGGNDWWWHGEFYPTMKFFRSWKGWKIEMSGIEKEAPHRNLCVRMKKMEEGEYVHRSELIYRNRIRPR